MKEVHILGARNIFSQLFHEGVKQGSEGRVVNWRDLAQSQTLVIRGGGGVEGEQGLRKSRCMK